MRGGEERHGRRGAEAGQSTVEFAAVLVGVLALLLALSAIWHGGEGGYARLQRRAASHSAGVSALGMLQDALVF